MRILLAIHAILLVLAASDFTALTCLIGEHSWKWCFYRYASSNSFGEPYTSDYTVLTTLTYLLAFAVGTVVFSAAFQKGRLVVGTLGFTLSSLGLVSFAIEASHWFMDHNRSWLAFSPAAMLVLALIAFLAETSNNPAAPKPKIAT